MRIAFISDITPVPLTAGPLVLYRHFRRMEKHQVLVISGWIPESDPKDKHWEVRRVPRRLRWLMRPSTRPLFEEFRSHQIQSEIRRQVEQFSPDIVLTVWMGEFLIAAYKIAKHRRIPLALICHDDFERMLPQSAHVRKWARHQLSTIYRYAATRLCVSEGMEAVFYRRYGVHGTVLYPIGETGWASLEGKGSQRSDNEAAGLRLGYAGQTGGGNHDVLLAVADQLSEVGGQLHISGPTQGPGRDMLGRHPAILDMGYFGTAQEMRHYFSLGVNAMLVVQSFISEDLSFVETCFPSKLVEASRFKLPLLIVAPPSSSASSWAKGHQGSSILVEEIDSAFLRQALNDLSDKDRRQQLSSRLEEVSSRMFDPDHLHSVLEEALLQAVKAS